MGTPAGLGKFESRGDAPAPPSFGIGECVEHCGRTVEVRSQPVAFTAWQERIKPDEDIASEMSDKYVVGQRQVAGALLVDEPGPAARDGGRPALPPSPMVLPAERVHVTSGAEHVGVQRELVGGGRVVGDHAGLMHRDGRLLICRHRVAAQLQQSRQPRVLLTKLLEFAQQ